MEMLGTCAEKRPDACMSSTSRTCRPAAGHLASKWVPSLLAERLVPSIERLWNLSGRWWTPRRTQPRRSALSKASSTFRQSFLSLPVRPASCKRGTPGEVPSRTSSRNPAIGRTLVAWRSRLSLAATDVETVVDPKDAARSAGLRYVSDVRPGIRRRRAGKGFSYTLADGSRLGETEVLRRIKSLAVPPAWTDVWICPFANGHIQATGRDARGRKQYRYHPRFREMRESTKYEHVIAFAEALPNLRAKVKEHMGLRGLPREKVLATIVHLLETTLIRVGNDDYARQNESYGLTTLKDRHAAVNGNEVRFRFTGKGGKHWSLRVRDRRIAKIIRTCQDLPGQELLQYLDEDGHPRGVSSSDVNTYLQEITGLAITAKDFRTWAGTVLAAMALNEMRSFDGAAQAKRHLRAAIESVAARLGNTATICRKCYVHPEVLTSYLDGKLMLEIKSEVESKLRDELEDLRPAEVAVLAFLRSRLARDVAAQAKAA
jgi:DNA topoisomerase I